MDKFMVGWWNCFVSFADEIFFDKFEPRLLEKVLEGAGISKEEIQEFLDSDLYRTKDIEEFLKRQILYKEDK